MNAMNIPDNTPGEEYVRAFLPNLDRHDAEAIAVHIDDGFLVACPHCHFLGLAFRPFASRQGAPVTGCDVCVHLADPKASPDEYASEAYQMENGSESILDQLTGARESRAITLLELWSAPVMDAELWQVACARGEEVV